MAVRRITADRRELIRQLAEILSAFLPLTARSQNTITFQTIFAESGIAHYLEGEVKKQALQCAWEKVFRQHQKLPSMLIRKIVPAAIGYRCHKRNPLKQEELDSLISTLEALGVGRTSELRKIKLDETVPEIRIPPRELVRRLENHPLVADIATAPLELFRNGHFNEAVRKAAERFESSVQQKTGLQEIGKSLMSKVFSLTNPLISLNSLATENEKGIQEGYMFMTMGLMRGIRNIFSHGDEDQRSPEECYEMLLFINWLFRHLPS
jgi:uncharacterized protein (TIGR02391 family)